MQHHPIIVSDTNFSSHAKVQMQRRCIPKDAVDLILDYADWTSSGSGTRRYRFTNRSWGQAAAALGSDASKFEKFRNAYVIEGSDGTIVTAAWLL